MSYTSEMTHTERFSTVSTSRAIYAAPSLGCPSMLYAVDRNEFKKTDEEKSLLYTMKKQLKEKGVRIKRHKFTQAFRGNY